MRYLTKQEVAEVLRVSVRTVTDYMSKGLLPSHKKLGRRPLWSEAEIFLCIDSSPVHHAGGHVEAQPVRRGRPRKLIS